MMNEDGPVAKFDLFARPSTDELNLLSVNELHERIVMLREEITRAEGIMSGKQGAFSDAEAIFKK